MLAPGCASRSFRARSQCALTMGSRRLPSPDGSCRPPPDGAGSAWRLVPDLAAGLLAWSGPGVACRAWRIDRIEQQGGSRRCGPSAITLRGTGPDAGASARRKGFIWSSVRLRMATSRLTTSAGTRCLGGLAATSMRKFLHGLLPPLAAPMLNWTRLGCPATGRPPRGRFSNDRSSHIAR